MEIPVEDALSVCQELRELHEQRERLKEALSHGDEDSWFDMLVRDSSGVRADY